MDLSMKWLADYVDCDMPIKDFVSGLTLSGSKVERYEEEGSDISNVVVGKLLSVVPHENSDHLVVCQVEVGKDAPIQIVTGAPNVSAGDYVPVALDGSTLPGGIKIKKGKLRGVESNGMLCSLGELGLTLHDFPYAIEDGIFLLGDDCDKTVGMDIHKAIGLDDTCVEFEITSNRPDCMSVIGLARETAATFGKKADIKEPAFTGVEGNINDMLSVEISNKELCPRYMAGIVKNVKIEPSPRWMRERLRACGVRPINNLVDITNYVMLEYGHPMHAFDLRYVEGAKINIRNAQKGEKIMTLDGVERELSEEMLVIADGVKPVAVAGVMGGEFSGIMDDTNTVVFESACFDGASVRTTAKKLGMRTDASSRFEKGLNPQGCVPALMRALQLVEMLGAGECVNTIIDCDYSDKTPAGVEFSAEWINKFLGSDLSEEAMVNYLESVGFKVENGMAYAPYYRIDIECKADIAEEVARLYDYNSLPSTIVRGVAQAQLSPKQKFEREVKRAMVALGYNEITTYSFISPKYLDKICLPADSKLRNAVVITNPLGEDTSIMRTTALPSMCEIISKNYNNRNPYAMLFELGNEYIPVDGEVLPNEPARLTIGAYDNSGSVDFFTLKGAVEAVLDRIGLYDYEVEAASADCGFDEVSAFHPGRVAVIKKDEKAVAILGELSRQTAENYGVNTRVYAAKLNLPEIMEMSVSERIYKPLPKYPAATRDISVVCDDAIPVAKLEKAIKGAVGKTLESIKLFDVYKGKQVDEGKKSVSYSIVMRSHEGTLTDEQADGAMKRVFKALAELGAELRS
ncbi:MAG: phenylalanine--tRNA ligase subunit beta [Oscillospiraceae bacterium]|nr:phenylalanine--tRNA ligase subunit beta [Oscillospiraceae bacterium]